MSATKNLKPPQHVAHMVAAAMATSCPVRLLLLSITLGLGFALGIVATVSFGLPAGALEIFFPPTVANLSATVRPQQHQQAQPTLRSPPLPVAAEQHTVSEKRPADAAAPVRISDGEPQQRQPPAQAAPRIRTSSARPPAVDTSNDGEPQQRESRRAGPPIRTPAADTGNSTARPADSADASAGLRDISDADLMALASAAPRERPASGGGAQKVAFLFLTKWDLPMAPLWEKFFAGHRGLYSVYVHSDPAFNGTEPEQGSVFYRRRIPSKEVIWGQFSMVEAERRLLAHALLDHSNARFILLSETHVPLFDFPTVRSYLLNSTQVFIESYDQRGATGRGRYSRHMEPLVQLRQWRKGSQWFELDRRLAADVVADDQYFPLFKRHCRRGCYADEHYLPTLLHIRHPWAVANRSVTWVDWSRGGPHPAHFVRNVVTVDFLRGLREGSTCTYNGRTTNVCFLFARKFHPNSLTRFLRFAPKVMGFG